MLKKLVTDEIIELNDHIIGAMFSRAKRHHEEQFTELNKNKNNMFRLFFQIINVGVRNATYVLDGLLYHESDLLIEEHYTDTSGFTDQVFALRWLQDVELRRCINAGLNKGESRNGLAKAVFLNRMGEIRDRSFENQRLRASGLNLITAAIILWNTVYIERVIKSMKANGKSLNEDLLRNLSTLNWDHINLTGRLCKRFLKGKFRPLRPFLGS